MKPSVSACLRLLGGAAVVVLPAMAAAQTTSPTEPEDEIVVTGIRKSLERAAEIKRDADQVLDVVTADDVGKLPDANVAEALQRVTGVQITREFGEGQSVSIRGLQQVRVEVDGRTLLGYSASLSPPGSGQLGRSSGLDTVPSSLFGRLEVRKSPLASQVEGGLGGSVNLVTPKPFDFKEATVSLRATGTYSEGSEKFEPGFNALATTTLADGRIGILLSGEYQKRTNTIQAFERNNFFATTNGNTAADAPTLFRPNSLRYEQFNTDRSRYGLSGAVQFEIVPDDLVLTIDGLYSKLETERFQEAFTWTNGGNRITNTVVEDGFIVAGNTVGQLESLANRRAEPTVSQLYGGNLRYTPGNWTVQLDGYYSRGTQVQNIDQITLRTATSRNVPGAFDFRADGGPSLVLDPSFDLTSAANYDRISLVSTEVRGVLEEYTGRADVSYAFDNGITLLAGARYRKLDATNQAFNTQTGNFAPFAANNRLIRSEIDPRFVELVNSSTFVSDLGVTFPIRFAIPIIDRDFIIQRTLQSGAVVGQPNANSARDYDLTEKTYAGYLMFSADGELLGMRTRANAGVRFVNTDFRVLSFVRTVNAPPPGTILPSRVDTSNDTQVLPSANVAFNVTDDFLVRVAASQTQQRAGIGDLSPSTFVAPLNGTATGGNAQLRPTVSSQGDLSFEYYTSRSSLISGAFFYKSVEDFVADETVLAVFEETGPTPIPFTRPGNIGSAIVKGFEVGITQFFDFLPSPLDGFGVIANYTYSDSKDQSGNPLVGVSKDSYNLIGLYEKGPFSARVAYNYRDEAVFSFTEGRPDFIDARSQLDAQLGFDVTENIQLQAQALNLSPVDSATREYSVIPVALNSYALSERRYTVGLRIKL